ncbi:hypothetical protein HHI36_005239 [Cryptolaemus montrouzieri]|uniref:Uncharacterized protein n=1 Tax=Cryptolaemus montrouzieri TaxID=559131 RepID=A0ABD2NTH9_9CUCU
MELSRHQIAQHLDIARTYVRRIGNLNVQIRNRRRTGRPRVTTEQEDHYIKKTPCCKSQAKKASESPKATSEVYCGASIIGSGALNLALTTVATCAFFRRVQIYIDHSLERQVLPNVKPGYLQECMPEQTPEHGEHWKHVVQDMDEYIVPGLTHWQSPSFHTYYPTASSYAGIIGEMMLSGIGGITTTWDSNPASVELELKMMDWLAKMMDLPDHFLNSSDGLGGGSIQGPEYIISCTCHMSCTRCRCRTWMNDKTFYLKTCLVSRDRHVIDAKDYGEGPEEDMAKVVSLPERNLEALE